MAPNDTVRNDEPYESKSATDSVVALPPRPRYGYGQAESYQRVCPQDRIGERIMSEPASTPEVPSTDAISPHPEERLIYRHTRAVRIMHWVNFLCLLVLLMSGFQIFNAHPSLYWGERSDRDRPLLAITADVSGSGQPKGTTSVFGHEFNTTGVLGVSKDSQDRWSSRGFPAWATLPSERWLAMARRWHLFSRGGSSPMESLLPSTHLSVAISPEISCPV